MKTSNFHSYQGPGRVSIARFAPRNIPAGYRIYSKLAPGTWFNKVHRAEYDRLFKLEILDPLDPQAAWDDLHRLAAPHEPIILCWERPQDLASGKTYCHRRHVAEWFLQTLGLQVDELPPAEVARSLRETERNLRLLCEKCGGVLTKTAFGPACAKCITASAT